MTKLHFGQRTEPGELCGRSIRIYKDEVLESWSAKPQQMQRGRRCTIADNGTGTSASNGSNERVQNAQGTQKVVKASRIDEFVRMATQRTYHVDIPVPKGARATVV